MLLSRGKDRDVCRSTHKETANVRWLRKRSVHVGPRLALLDLVVEEKENVDEQKRRGAPRAQPPLPLGAVSPPPASRVIRFA
jgi:hypothetical protein